MKTAFTESARCRSLFSGLSATFITALFAALAARADTAYTSTGWVTSNALPLIVCINAAGQVLLRGNAHTVAVQSTDARLTGQRLVFANGSVQADGTVLVWGACYQQVGTFDPNTNFTATAGLWEITYNGVMQTDNSLQLNFTGYGSGGAIDGQRMVETMTRGPASAPIDTAVPYLYTGTLKPAPLNLSQVVDNFDDNGLTGWSREGSGTYLPLLEANGQFTVRGRWPGVVTHAHADTYAWGRLNTNWSVANGRTLEWRVDLVGMSENATNAAAIVPVSYARPQLYILYKGRDFVELGKWVGSGMAVFFYDHQAVKNTNVVLSLALTRVDSNLVLTARVLDKDNQEAVLYQRSFMDTPQADATLTSAQLLALSGMNLNIVSDQGGPPIISGDAVCLNAWQYTDGNQPEVDVTYDNLELRTADVPFLGIERAVRVSWPALGTINYAVEGAPTVQGPWLPVQDATIPGMNQVTVPANGFMRFFRAVQAP